MIRRPPFDTWEEAREYLARLAPRSGDYEIVVFIDRAASEIAGIKVRKYTVIRKYKPKRRR